MDGLLINYEASGVDNNAFPNGRFISLRGDVVLFVDHGDGRDYLDLIVTKDYCSYFYIVVLIRHYPLTFILGIL